MSEEFKIPYQDITDININNLIVERNALIQENKQKYKDYAKQLKEELERSMKANIVLDNTNTNYASIIFDLEEWVEKQKEHFDKTTGNVNIGIYIAMREVLDKIQELKEKYK